MSDFDEGTSLADLQSALVIPSRVPRGFTNPLIQGGIPVYSHEGLGSIQTDSQTTCVVAQLSAHSTGLAGQLKIIMTECTRPGVVNTSAPVHEILIGPECADLYRYFSIIGGTISLSNTSSDLDRAGTYTAGVLYDDDDVRIEQITPTKLNDLAGVGTITGYTGEDGLVVHVPSIHMGEQMIATHSKEASVAGKGNSVDLAGLSERSFHSSAIGDVSKGALRFMTLTATTSGTPNYQPIFDTDFMNSDNSAYSSFVFPNNIYTVGVDMNVSYTTGTGANAIQSLWHRIRIFDVAGTEMTIGDGVADNMIASRYQTIDSPQEGEMVTGVKRVVSGPRPIAKVVVEVWPQASSGTCSITRQDAKITLSTYAAATRYTPRTGVIVATGLKGTSSISVKGCVALAARLNGAQQSLANPTPTDIDVAVAAAAMRATLNALVRHPVTIGRNEPALAAAMTYEMMMMEHDAAFGFRDFKKFGKKLLHVAKKAAVVGEMMGVPGAELGGKLIESVESGIEHAKRAHKELKDKHAEKTKDIDDLVARAGAIKL